MKLQERLKIIGLALTNKDFPVATKEVKIKEKLLDQLGGFIDFGRQNLSSAKTVSSKLLLANEGWVYRNNDVIAQEVSKVEFELFTVGLSQGEIVFNQIDSHPLLDLLDKPNQETTKSDAIYIIQSHKKLTGDAFWLKIRNGSQVVSLQYLPPDKIRLNLRSPTAEDPTIIESYQYIDNVDGQGIDLTYNPKDIIHFKKPNPNNPFRGLGAVEALRNTIDIDNLTQETTKNYFVNGSIQNFALTTESKVNEEQLKRLKAEMRASISGTRNAFNVPVFGNGLTPVDISYSNKDMQFLDQLEWYRDKIMIGFGNTKASLGVIDDVNRASHESSINEWLTSTVKPDMESIVNTLNEFLVPEFGQNLVLGFANPVPEDRTDDIEEATKLYQGNIIMRSEARELLDYETDDSDNVYHDTSLAVTTPDGVMAGDNDEEVDQEVEDSKDEED